MYLHGFIDKELYMQPPIGYTKVQPGQVCKLQHSLYGFKQDGRQWNKELTSKLNSYGFQQSMHDNYLFVKGTTYDFLGLFVHVDDSLLPMVMNHVLLLLKNSFIPRLPSKTWAMQNIFSMSILHDQPLVCSLANANTS